MARIFPHRAARARSRPARRGPPYGRRLPRLPREAGLTDVRADACFPVTGPARTALEAATVRQGRDQLVAKGLATDTEIDTRLAAVAAGDLDLATSPTISAWGRKPR